MYTDDHLDFESALQSFAWAEIKDCAGRYVLKGREYRHIPPNELFGIAQSAQVFTSFQASDTVLVLPIHAGGFICYRKPDNTYVHTLGNQAGFERKLAQLGISLLGINLAPTPAPA